MGTGPFGHKPAGRFNFDVDPQGVEYVEEFPRWIRGRLGGETVVDSRRPRLLWEHKRLPAFYFPREDVQLELIPEGAIRERDGLIGVEWDAMDEWLDEDEPLIGHARDPYHRIDVRDTSRHVRVSVHGEVIAESTRTRVLFETGLPPRFYFPAEDVRTELLEPSDKQTTCAYKGFATHLHLRLGDHFEDDLVWTYRDPLHDAFQVKDMLAFYNERVDLELDGESQERPITPWSR
jgi:uncharacterized protein (DUF427 family)